MGSGLGFGLGIGIRIKIRIGIRIGIGTVIGSFFMKNMSSGIIFSAIFGFVGYLFVSFYVSERFSTCSVSWGRLGAQNKVAVTCP